ncbi:MAG: hypothetical protein EOP22_09470 [Hyphomicrobiales bacterium]|nr:MAG: hypothetical protein EOP22_09470 [Hyphomicrobiales bacterium]
MRVLCCGAVLVLGACLPAVAADVNFSGTLTGVCTLGLSTPGILGLAADGSLSSTAGVPAILTVLSVGTNTLTINPPVWVSPSPNYVAGDETFEVAYAGLAGLGLADQVMTDTVTTRTVNTLPLSLLTMNAKATNSLGFADGSYSMKVVVTCS